MEMIFKAKKQITILISLPLLDAFLPGILPIVFTVVIFTFLRNNCNPFQTMILEYSNAGSYVNS